MIREIVRDTGFLSIPCKLVTDLDTHVNQVIDDLLDTAMEHTESDNCVGLAANQISNNLRVIVGELKSLDDTKWTVMINPVIKSKSKQKHLSEEGCLSLKGIRTVNRYNWVEVMYKDVNGKIRTVKLSGFDACIVQHEIDHLNGKLI